jgi:adenylate cyclase class IV
VPRNIEIKAKIADRRSVEKRIAAIADSGPEEIRQEDVFFRLMDLLGVSKKSLIDGAYLDLILRSARRRRKR